MPFCVQEAGPTLEQVMMSYKNSNLILLCVRIKVYSTALCAFHLLHLWNELPNEISMKSRVNSAEEKEESPFLNIRAGRGHTCSNDPLIKELKN